MNFQKSGENNLFVPALSKTAILIAAFTLLYFDTFASLVSEWSARDDYSHGYLIPFVSIYFIWADRERLRQIPIQPATLSGLTLLLIGALTLIIGDTGGIIAVKQVSLLITLPALVLLLLGGRFFYVLALPLAYLVLMIPPVLDVLIGWMHWPAQLFTANTASILLALINIPVYQHAQFLELPNKTLEVANACSGVRYLISIIAIGIPLAVFSQRTISRRVLLIVLSLLVGIISNPVRVALISIWAYNGGEVTHGPLHILQGLFVSFIGFIFLFLFAWVLSRSSSAVRFASSSADAERRPEQGKMSTAYSNLGLKKRTNRETMKRFNNAWLASLGVFVAAGIYLFAYEPVPVPLGKDLYDFPAAVGQWQAVSEGRADGVPTPPGADNVLSRTYRNSQGRELNLYVGYFASQARDKQFVNWNMRMLYEDRKEIIVNCNPGYPVRISSAAIQSGMKKNSVLYWHYLNGSIISGPYRAKIMTALNSLIRRTNGAVVIISGNGKNNGNVDVLLNDELECARDALPILSRFFAGK